jgi:cytidine deaminase
MPTKDSENSFPDWLKVIETSETLCLNFNIKASSVQHGRFDPQILADSSLENIPYQGKVVRISSPDSNFISTWICSFFAYSAYQHKAKRIEVFRPSEDYLVIYPVDILENSRTKGDYFEIEQQQNHLTLTLNPNKSTINYKEIQTNPLKLPHPQTDCPLILTGKASLWLYAYAAVVAAMNKFELVFVDNRHESYWVSVGKMNPGDIVRKNQTTNEPGLVVGIVGDPNSGKSVFAKWLYHFIKNEIPNSWQYNADAASPTTDHGLAMIKIAPIEAEKLKNQNKISWTPELEEYVAARLRTLKVYLDLTIADFPGGKSDDHQNIQRIPQGREVMMHEIDWFIILGKEGNAEEIFQGWREELRREGLEDRIIAEIVSKDHEGTPSLSICRNNNLFRGVATGLDRNKNGLIENQLPEVQKTFRLSLSELLVYFKYWKLAAHCRAATAQAFLTKPDGVRYGAAVLAQNGIIYQSGQYSSFNHATNVHAEQAALVLATMAGHPNITALAVSSNNSGNTPTRPCGVCRQVMLEHAERIGYDFDVVMVASNGWFEIAKVSELLPYSWSAGSVVKTLQNQQRRFAEPKFVQEKKGDPQTGDMILFGQDQRRFIALVWDSLFDTKNVFVKIKYYKNKNENSWVKISHAFTEPFDYICCINKLGLKPPKEFGQPVCLVAKKEIEAIGHSALQIDDLPTIFGEMIHETEIDSRTLCRTGSRLVGLQNQNSDHDIVLQATPEQAVKLRKIAGKYLQNGKIVIPSDSGTWKLLDKIFPGGHKRILNEDRFLETFEIEKQKISLMLLPKESQDILYDDEQWTCEGHHALSGNVVEAGNAPFKRSTFYLHSDLGQDWEIAVYYKLGNLVKKGDRVSFSGWVLRHKQKDRRRFVLFSPATDVLTWNQ